MLGAIDNAGTLEVNGVNVFVGAPGVTLSGGGMVVSTGTIEGYSTADVLTNLNNTLSGGGLLNVTLVNESAGVIDGAGMLLRGTITNAGVIEATGAGGDGLVISSAVIDNGASGVMLASGVGERIELQGADIVGGVLETGAGGSIASSVGANTLDGRAYTLANRGVLVVTAPGLTVEGAIANSGTIFLRATRQAAALIVGAAGVTLSGAGRVSLTDSAVTAIEGATSTATLTNVDDTLSGAGSLGEGQMILVNQAGGLIEATGSNALIIDTGADVVTNAGTIEAIGLGGLIIDRGVRNTGLLSVALGTLTVAGAVIGVGKAAISGGTLDFAGGFNQAVTFTGSEGELELARSQTYGGSIRGFSTSGGMSLDLGDIAFVDSGEATFSGTAAAGVLTVGDGTHTARLHLIGDYLGSTFTASGDGHGGTSVVAGAASPATRPHALIAAMAALGAAPVDATHVARAWSARELLLASSREVR